MRSVCTSSSPRFAPPLKIARNRIDFLCVLPPGSPRSQAVPRPRSPALQEHAMGDLIFLVVGLGAFALLALYVFGCGRA